MTESYYPENAIACLRRSGYDSGARPSLEMLSGSLIWDDELDDYMEFIAHCRSGGCLCYWEPILYRTSVIQGQPDEGSRRGWEELQQACPEWPGFRADRRSKSLQAELERQRYEES